MAIASELLGRKAGLAPLPEPREIGYAPGAAPAGTGAGDPWQGMREQNVVAALGNEEPAALRAARQARGISSSNQATADALLADSPQPLASPEASERAIIAALLSSPWTADLGEQMFVQKIERDEWNRRRQYEAQQAEAARRNGLVDCEAKREIDRRFEKPTESFQTLTADEVQQLGLPPGVYQRSTDGGIDKVADAPKPGEVEWQELPNGDFGFFDPATRQIQKLGSAPKPASSGSGVTISPDGTVQIGGQGMKLTEGQSKDLNYFTRRSAALPTIEANEAALASAGQRAADGVPLVGNYLTSEAYQVAIQAGCEFLAAILRKDTNDGSRRLPHILSLLPRRFPIASAGKRTHRKGGLSH